MEKQKTAKKKNGKPATRKKKLLEPGQPGVTATHSAEFAGKHPTPEEAGPTSSSPALVDQAPGQTTRS